MGVGAGRGVGGEDKLPRVGYLTPHPFLSEKRQEIVNIGIIQMSC